MKGSKVVRSAVIAAAVILMMAAPVYASKQVLTFNNSTNGRCGWSSGKDGNGWPTPNNNAIAYKVSGEGIYPSDSTKPARSGERKFRRPKKHNMILIKTAGMISRSRMGALIHSPYFRP